MSRFAFFLVAILPLGCIPVSEPLCDPDTVEPDKNLLGEWKWESGGEFFKSDMKISIPNWRNKPKGLMMCEFSGGDSGQGRVYFFAAKLGEATYVNIFGPTAGEINENNSAAWKNSEEAVYKICRYSVKGNELLAFSDDSEAVYNLMNTEKIPVVRSDFLGVIMYVTPPGRLAKLLTKNGPEQFFPTRDTGTTKWSKKPSEVEIQAEATKKIADREKAFRRDQEMYVELLGARVEVEAQTLKKYGPVKETETAKETILRTTFQDKEWAARCKRIGLTPKEAEYLLKIGKQQMWPKQANK